MRKKEMEEREKIKESSEKISNRLNAVVCEGNLTQCRGMLLPMSRHAHRISLCMLTVGSISRHAPPNAARCMGNLEIGSRLNAATCSS